MQPLNHRFHFIPRIVALCSGGDSIDQHHPLGAKLVVPALQHFTSQGFRISFNG